MYVFTFHVRYLEAGVTKHHIRHIVARDYLIAMTKWCALESVQDISMDQIIDTKISHKES